MLPNQVTLALEAYILFPQLRWALQVGPGSLLRWTWSLHVDTLRMLAEAPQRWLPAKNSLPTLGT